MLFATWNYKFNETFKIEIFNQHSKISQVTYDVYVPPGFTRLTNVCVCVCVCVLVSVQKYTIIALIPALGQLKKPAHF